MVTVEETPEVIQLYKPTKHTNHKLGYGVRHIQTALFFLCFTTNFMSRSHMGVTIVAMTSTDKGNNLNDNDANGSLNFNNNITNNDVERIKVVKKVDGVALPKINETFIERELNEFVNNNNEKFSTNDEENEHSKKLDRVNLRSIDKSTSNVESMKISVQTFDWPKSTQEMILGSFNLGYCIMMLPIGLVCQRWGGKIPLQISLFVTGIVSILAPWLTCWGGWRAMCVCRILQGLTQVGTFPSIHTLLSKWVPAFERAKITSYVYTGSPLGNLIAFQMGGLLGGSQWGWPAMFYTAGVISLIMFGILTKFGAATPMEHSSIGKEERKYILETTYTEHVQKLKIPWRSILTSKHVWAIFSTHVGNGISYMFFYTQVPSYIHYILGVNIKNSGLLSSLPIIGTIFLSIFFGWLSDYATNKKIISIKTARRIFNCIGQFGAAFSLLYVAFTNNVTIAIACFFIAMGVDAAANCAWMVNYIDLAPNFSGLVLAIGNSLMNIGMILVPIVVSCIVIDVKNILQWRIMFLIVAGVCFVTNTIFLIFMSVETQPWNYSKAQHHEEIKDKENICGNCEEPQDEQSINLILSESIRTSKS